MKRKAFLASIFGAFGVARAQSLTAVGEKGETISLARLKPCKRCNAAFFQDGE